MKLATCCCRAWQDDCCNVCAGVDTVARLGGDEFVVLIQELSTDWVGAFQQAMAVGQKILSSPE